MDYRFGNGTIGDKIIQVPITFNVQNAPVVDEINNDVQNQENTNDSAEEKVEEEIEIKVSEIKDEIPKQVETKKDKVPIPKKKIVKKEKTENVLDNKKISDDSRGLNENKNFISNGNGGYTALSPAGITYRIIRQSDPSYPVKAEQMRYQRNVSVTAKFLVGFDGNIENIQIVNGNKVLGFDDEVISALRKWKFSPIYYKNISIKVYFTKTFVFKPKK
jgi:protein TonB